MATANDVAKLLIRLAAADPEGESMTSMRLHKLLYYCQGWYLAWYGEPLFADPIEAWMHGPVVRSVYSEPWGHGSKPIPVPTAPVELGPTETEAIEHVWHRYEQFSAIGLRSQTHAELPWQKHYDPSDGGRCTNEIPIREIAEFFGRKLFDETGESPGVEKEFLQAVHSGGLKTLDQVLKELGW